MSFTVVGDESSSTLDAVRAVARDRAFLQSQPDECILVDKYDDILRAKKEGKVAIGLHFQGTVRVGRELKLVEGP
ncbi:amidohydrolase family protein [Paraburkholderia diazotrophica]|uniref:membrane dipeptidase n=1 Tax=Paraburkholderia diazotrophica TaxID=667676 RepID=UPI0015A731EB